MQTKGHLHLSAFVGKWKTEGQVKGDSGTPDIQISGTDTYEWLPGEFLLLHTIDVMIGEEHKKGVEVIGYEVSTDSFRMHYFDEDGNTESMQAILNDGVWRFEGTSIRFTGKFSNDGLELSGIWEQKKDDLEWKLIMVVRLNKEV